LCDCEENIVLQLFAVGFVLFLFVSLRCKHSKCVKEKNKIVCNFGLTCPRISAYLFHEWIYDQMCLNDQEATMLQIDCSKRHVHINFRNNGRK